MEGEKKKNGGGFDLWTEKEKKKKKRKRDKYQCRGDGCGLDFRSPRTPHQLMVKKKLLPLVWVSWRWFYPVRPTNSYTQLEQNIRADPVQTSSNQIELESTGLLQPAGLKPKTF